MQARQLQEGFEEDFATLLVGTDSLFGGDALHESGTHHFIVDSWISGMNPPEVYRDPLASQLRSQGGAKPEQDMDAVNDYVAGHQLRELPDKIRAHAASFDPDRRRYIENQVDSVAIMLESAIAGVNGMPRPTFEEMYRTLTRRDDIELSDPREDREQLREALAIAGFEVTPTRNLRETYIAFKNSLGFVPVEKVATEARIILEELLQTTRERMLPVLDPKKRIGHWNSLSEVPFDGHEFRAVSGVRFTGSSIYRGGQNGRPLLQGLFEYNTEHRITRPGLHHLCAHEVMPGHYLNAAVIDLLWRGGNVGFESTVGTMLTPSTIFQEGWAQNTYELLYGDREVALAALGDERLANQLRIELINSDLQDKAKHNASLLFQGRGVSLDEVKRHIGDDCVQWDPIVKKLSGIWAQDSVFGPMYGPAYVIGREAVNDAIKTHGSQKVIQVGLHYDGLVDLETFQTKLARLS